MGGYQLGSLVDDGGSYQEHLARNQAVEHDQVRVRSYLVPAATSVERRAQLQRAARREARTLAQIGQHPRILAYRTFVDDGPLGPAVLFEPFEDGLPLHVFLRQHPDLTFDERLGILQQVVEAVAHCHRADVLHRNLSPAAVLVRRDSADRVQVRLHRFHTAAWVDHSSVGTSHLHELAQSLDRLYQAPEVLSDPHKATYESDAFSVGCLAWLLFTDQHPATILEEREKRIRGATDGEGGSAPRPCAPTSSCWTRPLPSLPTPTSTDGPTTFPTARRESTRGSGGRGHRGGGPWHLHPQGVGGGRDEDRDDWRRDVPVSTAP